MCLNSEIQCYQKCYIQRGKQASPLNDETWINDGSNELSYYEFSFTGALFLVSTQPKCCGNPKQTADQALSGSADTVPLTKLVEEEHFYDQ